MHNRVRPRVVGWEVEMISLRVACSLFRKRGYANLTDPHTAGSHGRIGRGETTSAGRVASVFLRFLRVIFVASSVIW